MEMTRPSNLKGNFLLKWIKKGIILNYKNNYIKILKFKYFMYRSTVFFENNRTTMWHFSLSKSNRVGKKTKVHFSNIKD